MRKTEWQHLIPHRGAMCLLDEVIAWDETRIHARTLSHRDPANALRSNDGLRSVHLCEYGAQAMALHGGLLAQRDGAVAAPGLLVSLRAVRLERARIHDLAEALDVRAEQLLAAAGGWQYAFEIACAGVALASGRAAVMLLDDGGGSV